MMNIYQIASQARGVKQYRAKTKVKHLFSYIRQDFFLGRSFRSWTIRAFC